GLLEVYGAEAGHDAGTRADLARRYGELSAEYARSSSSLRRSAVIGVKRAVKARAPAPVWGAMKRAKTLLRPRLFKSRARGLVGATYRLRAMRLLGGDRFADLAAVSAVLEAGGFRREVAVADAMYGGHADGEARCRGLLDDALSARAPAETDGVELLDDRRPPGEPRASVIVSLYRAAEKLPRFLRVLEGQTLIRRGLAEVVLVDSHSPTDERRVFQEVGGGLRAVYLRSERRETIQRAWNRGIALA